MFLVVAQEQEHTADADASPLLLDPLVAPVLAAHTRYSFRYRSNTQTGDGTRVTLACEVVLSTGLVAGADDGSAAADSTSGRAPGRRLLTVVMQLQRAHLFQATQAGPAATHELDDTELGAALTRAPATLALDVATGQLVALRVDAADPLWVGNIKRAIAGLLQWQRPSAAEAEVALSAAPGEAPYHRVEDDIFGSCTVAHHLEVQPAPAGGELLRVHKMRQHHLDCHYRHVHHGRTHEADQDLLTRFHEGSTATRHVFNRTSGALLKVRFEDRQSAVVGGDPRQKTRTYAEGYLAFNSATAVSEDDQLLHDAEADFALAISAKVRRENRGVWMWVCGGSALSRFTTHTHMSYAMAERHQTRRDRHCLLGGKRGKQDGTRETA